MPDGTLQAIEWALQKTFTDNDGHILPVSRDTPQELIDFVRQYFNQNNIQYSTFNYEDLLPFLN